MANIPKQPPNDSVVGKDGQFRQDFARYWDAISRKADSAIQSFNEFFTLTEDTTPDLVADYLLAYDVSESTAVRVPMSAVAGGTATVIESKTVTAVASISFTDIPQTYSRLHFAISGIGRNSGTSYITAEFSVDNGSNYETSGVSGAISFVAGGPANVIGWVSGIAQLFAVDSTAGHDGFMSLDNYADASTVSKRLVSSGNRSTVIRTHGSGHLYGIGPVDAIRLTLTNFTANGTIVLIGYP